MLQWCMGLRSNQWGGFGSYRGVQKSETTLPWTFGPHRIKRPKMGFSMGINIGSEISCCSKIWCDPQSGWVTCIVGLAGWNYLIEYPNDLVLFFYVVFKVMDMKTHQETDLCYSRKQLEKRKNKYIWNITCFDVGAEFWWLIFCVAMDMAKIDTHDSTAINIIKTHAAFAADRKIQKRSIWSHCTYKIICRMSWSGDLFPAQHDQRYLLYNNTTNYSLYLRIFSLWLCPQWSSPPSILTTPQDVWGGVSSEWRDKKSYHNSTIYE